MQATYGSASRLRAGLFGCLMALVLLVSAVLLAPAAHAESAPATTTYLALGDSISFGYTEERFNLHFPQDSPSYFEEGVANDFAKDLRKGSELGKSIRIVNDACPGETSNGLIGENEAIGGKKSTESIEEVEGIPAEQFPAGGYQGLGDWHPCKYTNVNHLPLHNGGYHNGAAEVSQLEEALASIANPSSKVEAITLNIGSNDELAGITQCKDEVTLEYEHEGKSKYGPSPEVATVLCIKNFATNTLVPHIIANLNDIIGVIDGAGYKGPIVLMGFYNPDAFVLPTSDELQEAQNAAVETYVVPNFPNVAYANPFPVFNKGAGSNSAKEKESICKYTEMCNPNDPGGEKDEGDIHPTLKGYKELAKLVNAAFLELKGKGI